MVSPARLTGRFGAPLGLELPVPAAPTRRLPTWRARAPAVGPILAGLGTAVARTPQGFRCSAGRERLSSAQVRGGRSTSTSSASGTRSGSARGSRSGGGPFESPPSPRSLRIRPGRTELTASSALGADRPPAPAHVASEFSGSLDGESDAPCTSLNPPHDSTSDLLLDMKAPASCRRASIREV